MVGAVPADEVEVVVFAAHADALLHVRHTGRRRVGLAKEDLKMGKIISLMLIKEVIFLFVKTYLYSAKILIL